MTEPIRWGVLGASDFARRDMAPAIHAARGATLGALATRDPAKAAPFTAFAPGLRVYEGYDALLGDPEIDAVYVPLPNHLHVEWTLKALAAGKHVLCEKPVAMAEAEFDRLIAARDRTGRLVAEAFMIVHHPQWQRARSLLEAGAIGDLRHVDAIFTYDNSADPANVRNRAGMGGGALRDVGVYVFGGPRFATGAEPEDLTAALDVFHDFDTTARVTARFPSFSFGGLVSMRMSRRQEVTFHGTAGSLRLTCPFNAGGFGEARIEIARETETRVERFPGIDQYVLQVEAFGAAIRGEAAFPCQLEFSRGTQSMIDRSLASGGL